MNIEKHIKITQTLRGLHGKQDSDVLILSRSTEHALVGIFTLLTIGVSVIGNPFNAYWSSIAGGLCVVVALLIYIFVYRKYAAARDYLLENREINYHDANKDCEHVPPVQPRSGAH